MLPVIVKVLGTAAGLTAGYFGYKKYMKPRASVAVNPSTGKPLLQSMFLQHPTLGKIVVSAPVVGPSPFPPPPPIVATSQGTAYLHGDDVRGAQGQLNVLGYGPLTVDGVLGPLTKAALVKFQTTASVVADGTLSDATKAALTKALTAMSPMASVGASPIVANAGTSAAQATQTGPGQYTLPEQVITGSPQGGSQSASVNVASVVTNKDVQHALNVLGATPALVEDGVLGPKSNAATRAFQTAHGLVVDGVPGPKTKAALAIALATMQVAAGDLELTIRHGGDFQSHGADIHG